jgi:hypothetical protein
VQTDKKGRETESEVPLDERDPVFQQLRGLELTRVSERIEKEVAERARKDQQTKAKDGLEGARLAMLKLANDDERVNSKYSQVRLWL